MPRTGAVTPLPCWGATLETKEGEERRSDSSGALTSPSDDIESVLSVVEASGLTRGPALLLSDARREARVNCGECPSSLGLGDRGCDLGERGDKGEDETTISSSSDSSSIRSIESKGLADLGAPWERTSIDTGGGSVGGGGCLKGMPRIGECKTGSQLTNGS
jgi:hypothetical protein